MVFGAIASLAAISTLHAGAAPREKSITDSPYPAAVSLVNDESRGTWTYRQTLTDMPLYTSSKDPLGKSVCYAGCDETWIPVSAPADAKPLGDWTIIERRDHERQWAYRGHAVYTLIHDSIEKPTGDGKDGVWHILPYAR